MTATKLPIGPIIKFRNITCCLRWSKYQNNNRTAFALVNVDDGACEWMATVNLTDARLHPGEILIKTWSENAGLLECLIHYGVVKDTGRRVQTGFAEAAVCTFGPNAFTRPAEG